jgi:hypothetical protein
VVKRSLDKMIASGMKPVMGEKTEKILHQSCIPRIDPIQAGRSVIRAAASKMQDRRSSSKDGSWYRLPQ